MLAELTRSPAIAQERAVVTAHEQVGEGLYELWLASFGLAQALPGQFVHVRCGEATLRRPFSVHRTRPDAAALLYQVKGKGTRWLSTVRKGQTLDVLGPIGRPFSPPVPGERLLLVGGGIGMAPLALYAEQHARVLRGRVLAGFRSQSLVAGLAPCLASELAVTVVTDDGSSGRQGLVTDGLADTLLAEGITRVLTCGPEGMMRAVAAIASAHGIPCEASVERPMACGIGVCLGCVVPVHGADGRVHYERACQEGPVFDAREVVW
ncbi:MAG TPA: dihydroorotate dehydrogenase electron transfer subunit [Stenomitos sp.]